MILNNLITVNQQNLSALFFSKKTLASKSQIMRKDKIYLFFYRKAFY